MELRSVLVTGANRGIGLEFVKQLVNLPNPPRFVFATYRCKDTVKALENVKNASRKSHVVLIRMDVTKSEEVEAARKIVEEAVEEEGLNLLINNAGAMRWREFSDMTEDDWLFHFTTNTIGPINVLKEMLPLLQKSSSFHENRMGVSRAAVLNISSLSGSITQVDNKQSPIFLQLIAYRASKAALNMAMRAVAVTVKDQGIVIVNMCPGWVRTDMGTDEGKLDVTDSISAMLKTLSSLDESHHGSFMDRKGRTIPF